MQSTEEEMSCLILKAGFGEVALQLPNNVVTLQKVCTLPTEVRLGQS